MASGEWRPFYRQATESAASVWRVSVLREVHLQYAKVTDYAGVVRSSPSCWSGGKQTGEKVLRNCRRDL
jgi:hypothetical protein